MTPDALVEQMEEVFNLDDLKVLIFDLGIKYDNIPGETLREKIRKLIAHCARDNTLDALIDACYEFRPGHTWAKPQEPVLWAVQSGKEFIQLLSNPDPMICRPAVSLYDGQEEYLTRALTIPDEHEIVVYAIQELMKIRPRDAAHFLEEAVAKTGYTGESWQMGRRAAQYFDPVHRPFAERRILGLLIHGTIEAQRHVLVSLGRLGLFHLYTQEIHALLRDTYGLQKCFSFALRGASYNFCMAEQTAFDDLDDRARALTRLIQLPESVPNHFGLDSSFQLPLGHCNAGHVDTILKEWLPSEDQRIVKLGLTVLSRIRLKRSAPKILALWEANQGTNIGTLAAHALWRIGETQSIQRLWESSNSSFIEEGFMHLDEDQINLFVAGAGEETHSLLMIRALGLRGMREKIPFVRRHLSNDQFHIRGAAALALARLGETSGLIEAYAEANHPGERVFKALALLKAGLKPYHELEATLRADLAVSDVAASVVEVQEDILAVLREIDSEAAGLLADSWEPFLGQGSRDIALKWST